jgi:hypothetical protein
MDQSGDWKTVTFGSALEETPEGLFLMDRLRADADAERQTPSPLDREIADVIAREIDRAIFGLPRERESD